LSSNGTLVTTQTLGYNSISVQLTGNWVGEVIFQASNDNTNWVNVQGYAFNSTMVAIDTAVDNDIYVFPVIGRYFQAVVSDYLDGTVTATAYLRTQSLAGIGEASLTQAMDQTTGTPMNVTFPGMTSTVGQQSTVNSFPVTMATENVQDRFIVGRIVSGVVPIGTFLTVDPAINSAGPALNGWIDCTQYRSAYISISQSASVTTGAVTIEMSNDGVNTLSYPPSFYDTQGVAANNVSTANTISLGTATGATTTTRVGSIGWRYLRIRVTTSINIASSATVQAFITLRQTTSPYVISAQTNVNYLAQGSLPSQTATGTPTPLTLTNGTTTFLPMGGTDNSVVNPQLQGVPYPIASTNTSYVAGPFYRRNYVDYTGNVGVAGPDPRYAEDKTYPVNVRLERTTAGQDSVQDLLQQILVELKAMNYYTRETPSAIAQMMQYPSATAEYPTSMADEPESFVYDKNSLN
jgi:hypothetical protein